MAEGLDLGFPGLGRNRLDEVVHARTDLVGEQAEGLCSPLGSKARPSRLGQSGPFDRLSHLARRGRLHFRDQLAGHRVEGPEDARDLEFRHFRLRHGITSPRPRARLQPRMYSDQGERGSMPRIRAGMRPDGLGKLD